MPNNDQITTIRRIEGVNPILNVSDMAASVDFYVRILGFKNADWGNDEFTSVSRDSGAIYLCRDSQGQPGTWVWVGFDGDMHALHEDLKARGVTVRLPPTNYPWALEMHIEDPNGHVLRLGTDPEEIG